MLPLVIFLIVAVVLGACIGSFLNVVIYRLPEGLTVWKPMWSFCPSCKHRLATEDNIPVLSWFWLKGKCRYCAAAISMQYPVIEASTAGLFGVLFAAYYLTGLRPEFNDLGLYVTWVVMLVHFALLAGLIAATLIDYRYYVIPLSIPATVTAVALVTLPLSTMGVPRAMRRWEQVAMIWPVAEKAWIGAALGGVAGLVIANLLLYFKVIPRSFEDDPQAHDHAASLPLDTAQVTASTAAAPPGSPSSAGPESPAAPSVIASSVAPVSASADPGLAPASSDSAVAATDTAPAPAAVPSVPDPESPDAWLDHPHPRHEVGKEAVFVAVIAAAALLGALIWYAAFPAGKQPVLGLKVLGGVCLGYLVGGAIVWVMRIAGTLLFNKEAMGLGDVHLVAAIGAVVGPYDAVVVFFIAPFLGLAYALIAFGLGKVMAGKVRILQYGPWLAVATFLVLVLHAPIHRLVDRVYLSPWK